MFELPSASAEAAILGYEERSEVIARRPAAGPRQREALVLRFYLDLPDEEIARLMNVRLATVRSTIHPGPRCARLEALGEDHE